MSYMTLSSQEKPLFQKRIPWWHLFYSVRTFAPIRQHYFSKYWGDGCTGRPPTSNFGGTVPPVPLSFRPCQQNVFDALLLLTSQHVGVGQICYNKGCFVWRLTECSVWLCIPKTCNICNNCRMGDVMKSFKCKCNVMETLELALWSELLVLLTTKWCM